MNKFTASQLGKIVFIHMSKGEDVLQCICQAIREENIVSGMVVSAIGSLRKARYHYIGSTEDLPNDVFATVDAPLELACLQGLVIEGTPHLHMVFSEENRTYAGHLEEGCEVQYLAEVGILEVKDMPVVRKRDDKGVAYVAWEKE